MTRTLVVTVAGLGVVVGGLAVVFLAGMRSSAPLVLDGVRWFIRAVTNPRVLRSAGAPGATTSIIQHVGRRTGRPHETPIGAMPVRNGSLIALPYGTRADWVKNVLAADAATIIHDGTRFVVREPKLVPTRVVASLLLRSERRLLRIFNVEHFLHAAHASVATPAGTT